MKNTPVVQEQRKRQISGKKAHFENKFHKVSRIRYNSWAAQVLKACDIVIYERELVHIQNRHGKELDILGLTAFDFVKFIVLNFNEIYEGNHGAKILVVRRKKSSHYSVIELSFEEDRYTIKTALSIETKRLSKWKLLFANLAH